MALRFSSLPKCFCTTPPRTTWGLVSPSPCELPSHVSLPLVQFSYALSAARKKAVCSPSPVLRLRLTRVARWIGGSPNHRAAPSNHAERIQNSLLDTQWQWAARREMGTLAHEGTTPSPLTKPKGESREVACLSRPVPLRRRLRSIRHLDPILQRQVLKENLGRPRCQRAQRLLKRGELSLLRPCVFFPIGPLPFFSVAPREGRCS